MHVEALTQAVCDLALSFGEGGGSSKVRIHVTTTTTLFPRPPIYEYYLSLTLFAVTAFLHTDVSAVWCGTADSWI